jgi:uncharacterized protein YciI
MNSAPSLYYVVQMSTSYASVDEAKRLDPDILAAHVARSRELHLQGQLLMAGAFLDGGGILETMAITETLEAADAFAEGDPFLLAGKVTGHRVRPWANLFA